MAEVTGVSGLGADELTGSVVHFRQSFRQSA